MEIRGCIGKVAFATTADAVAHRRSQPILQRLSVYKCKFCGQHHLGHAKRGYRSSKEE